MMMNCDCSKNSCTIKLNLWLFASSRAASTSSRMQKGDGFDLKMDMRRAMQVMVFSPPESWEMETGFLPGGWAMISMPASRGSMVFFMMGNTVVPSGARVVRGGWSGGG